MRRPPVAAKSAVHVNVPPTIWPSAPVVFLSVRRSHSTVRHVSPGCRRRIGDVRWRRACPSDGRDHPLDVRREMAGRPRGAGPPRARGATTTIRRGRRLADHLRQRGRGGRHAGLADPRDVEAQAAERPGLGNSASGTAHPTSPSIAAVEHQAAACHRPSAFHAPGQRGTNSRPSRPTSRTSVQDQDTRCAVALTPLHSPAMVHPEKGRAPARHGRGSRPPVHEHA